MVNIEVSATYNKHIQAHDDSKYGTLASDRILRTTVPDNFHFS